jgi:hypothetical protein
MFVWFFFPPWTLVLSQSSCFLVSTKMERIPPIIIPLCKVLSGLHSPYPNFFGAPSYVLLHKSQQMYKLVSEIHSTTVQTPPKQAPAACNCISLFVFFFLFLGGTCSRQAAGRLGLPPSPTLSIQSPPFFSLLLVEVLTRSIPIRRRQWSVHRHTTPTSSFTLPLNSQGIIAFFFSSSWFSCCCCCCCCFFFFFFFFVTCYSSLLFSCPVFRGKLHKARLHSRRDLVRVRGMVVPILGMMAMTFS